MIFTHLGMRFRVCPMGGLDLDLDGEWIRFGWDTFGVEPWEWWDHVYVWRWLATA